MIQVQCACGAKITARESEIHQARSCPACGRAVRMICAEALPPDAGAADFDANLILRSPADVGGEQQFYLGGVKSILIGRGSDATLCLVDHLISRAHCTLNRLDFGPSRWSITDHKSANGLYLNGRRIEEAELHSGDILQIGNFRFVYQVAGAPAVAAAPAGTPAPPTAPAAGDEVCPSCGDALPAGARICVKCGINVKTGRPILVTKGIDEEELQVNGERIIRMVSWVLPFTLLPIPIASEGFGTKKPYAIWGIAALTTLASLIFFIATWGHPASPLNVLMLWPPHAGFRWYQLITHAFLHDNGSLFGFVTHLGGNMLFLLVFGSRVNALLGDLATLIVYPLLAVAAAAFDLYMTTYIIPIPTLGASGAIMGLAGIYLVLFPLHRIYCAMWIRWGLFMGFRINLKIFALRGFWVLLMYVGYDLVMGLLTRNALGGTAHWAHFGGFCAGVVLALAILCSRRINTYGGDLLSVLLGRRAWPLIGKPAQWQQ